jgi:hypothetical protein
MYWFFRSGEEELEFSSSMSEIAILQLFAPNSHHPLRFMYAEILVSSGFPGSRGGHRTCG